MSYGVDINSYAGDLVQHNSTVPTRLNPSFGSIAYTQNDRQSRFDALIIGVRTTLCQERIYQRLLHAILFAGRYAGVSRGHQPVSILRPFDLGFAEPAFTYRELHHTRIEPGPRTAGRLTGGWTVSGTTILQSGQPFTVNTTATFQPVRDSNGNITGLSAASGDYNADGDNNDYPNVANYNMGTGARLI